MSLSKNLTTFSVQELIPRYYFPQYQPVFDIESGLIMGYESLIRCIDKYSNTVSGSWVFDQGLTHDWIQLEIDRSVRKKALSRFSIEKRAGYLFLNVSPSLLKLEDLASLRSTREMVEYSGISPERVVVELTDVGEDFEIVKRLIHYYKRAGFKIAINDLGLDASQLQYVMLQKPNFLSLKLSDFRTHVSTGRQNQIILAMSLSKMNPELEILCEGVESEADFFFAMDCGASKIKGWLFGNETTILPKHDAYKDQIEQMKERYADHRQRMMKQHISKRKILANWLRLIAQHKIKNKIDNLNFSSLVRSGVLRFFVCDIEGKQKGGSINFRPNGYLVDTTYIDKNWKDRPYFLMANSLSKMKRGQYLVSNIYADLYTEQSCITLSMLLNEKTVLFMDVLVDDESGQYYDPQITGPALKLARIK